MPVHLQPDAEEALLLHVQGDLLSLSDAGVMSGALAMRPLNPAHVESLTLSDPQQWPPITVTLCTAGYIVIDGYHRWQAATRMHLDTIRATCRPYASENEVVEAAFRANLRHGLKASAQTKGVYAYWLFITYPDLQQVDIARRVGMTQGAVSKAIARGDADVQRALRGNEPDPQEREKQMQKACRTFTRTALKLLDETAALDDKQLLALLNSVLTKSDEKAKLARIGRLLGGNTRSGLLTQFTQPLKAVHPHQSHPPTDPPAASSVW